MSRRETEAQRQKDTEIEIDTETERDREKTWNINKAGTLPRSSMTATEKGFKYMIEGKISGIHGNLNLQ